MIVWDAEPLTEQREIQAGLTDRITALRALPDNARVVVADGQVAESGIVRILDLAEGRIERSWRAHDDTIFGMAVSANGKLLATAGGDKLVRLWEIETATETAKLEAHTTQVLGLAFSPDATQLATGGADRQLKVWDAKTRENTSTFTSRNAAFNALTWSAAGPAVFAVTDGGGLVRFTNLKSHTGAQSSEAGNERQLGHAEAALDCLAVSENGDRLFAGSADGRIFAWDKDGKALETTDAVAAKPTATARPEGAAAVTTESPAVAASAAINATTGAPVSFVRDVLPIIGKAGCNAGACHGKPDGQNGFRLSVFSFDPQSDYQNIVRGARGRRIFPSEPAESLLLLKATQTVPHEGGERFARDSDAHRALVKWIAAGMPFRHEHDPALTRIEVVPHEGRYRKGAVQQLVVRAHHDDGSVRDVTAFANFVSTDKQIVTVSDDGMLKVDQSSGEAVVIARFMGMVGDSRVTVPAETALPDNAFAGFPVNNFIDELAYARFRQLGLLPSAPCSDAEFLRRASLDTLGILPSADEAREFLADPDPLKRRKAIDRLLDHPAYADHWATKWADLLRPNPDRVGVKSVYVLDQWLREQFRQNTPYDKFVREILLTQGNTHRFGPAVIYRDRREPAELTTMFSQLFLGVRLDCAKCHHHPNEKWSQEDFYRMAAFFAPLKQKGGGISAPISGGSETFFVAAGASLNHPVTGEVMKPQPPDGPPAKVAGCRGSAARAG